MAWCVTDIQSTDKDASRLKCIGSSGDYFSSFNSFGRRHRYPQMKTDFLSNSNRFFRFMQASVAGILQQRHFPYSPWGTHDKTNLADILEPDPFHYNWFTSSIMR